MLVSWVACRRVVANARLEIHSDLAGVFLICTARMLISVMYCWQHEAITNHPTFHLDLLVPGCVWGRIMTCRKFHHSVSLSSFYIERLTANMSGLLSVPHRFL